MVPLPELQRESLDAAVGHGRPGPGALARRVFEREVMQEHEPELEHDHEDQQEHWYENRELEDGLAGLAPGSGRLRQSAEPHHSVGSIRFTLDQVRSKPAPHPGNERKLPSGVW